MEYSGCRTLREEGAVQSRGTLIEGRGPLGCDGPPSQSALIFLDLLLLTISLLK